MIEKAKAYGELLRVHNLIGTALGVLAGIILVSSKVEYRAIIAIISAVLIAGAGYAINDYFDIDIDKINKPSRPLPSGKIEAKTAYRLAIIMFVIGSLLPILIGPLTTAFAIFNAILMYYYSKVLKRTGFIGNLTVAFSTSATIFYGALSVLEPSGRLIEVTSILPVVFLTFSLTLAREVIKGIEDYYGDKENGVKTLAVVMGPKKAALIALLLTLSCFPLIMASYLWTRLGPVFLTLTTIGALVSLVSILKVIKSEDSIREAAKARRLTKISMFLGIFAILLDRGISLAFFGY